MYIFWVNFSDCAEISVTLVVHHGPEGCAQSANNRTHSASFRRMTFAMFYTELKVQLICNLVIAAGIFGFWLCSWCLGYSPSGVIISDWLFLRSCKLSGNTIRPWSVLPETKLSQKWTGCTTRTWWYQKDGINDPSGLQSLYFCGHSSYQNCMHSWCSPISGCACFCSEFLKRLTRSHSYGSFCNISGWYYKDEVIVQAGGASSLMDGAVK